MKIHAYTPYPNGVRLEVIGVINGRRRLIKSAILPWDKAMEDLKQKVTLTETIGV